MSVIYRTTAAFAVIWGAFSLASAANAQESTYTQLNEETCESLYIHEEGSSTQIGGRCAGQDGWWLYRQADDHGEWTAYSQGDAMPEDLQYGGYTGNFGNYHTVVEWRRDDAGQAFATIHRYYSMDFGSGEPVRQSVLVVTALRPEGEPESCHVGYVMASQIEDANVQARLMADEMAPHIDCKGHRPFRIDAEIPSVYQLISLQH